ncbi:MULTISPECIES: aspartate-alanine antiporter [unclassified Tatumella]|uniref:aspartate-alanine antiporter n=1 Tax=unclassified Tatumella TaxID=2649542 RepID=UPI001BAF1CA5|nr:MULTISPECIES: aspartate-alanine antiporter [unclassified Tatumella]MBS0856769.1 aspartate-alanine antiporter [Tatumella sp. JGM16]MBS0877777.1 aspartate-alanine antiporter [Tatumella sp. JGM82]MBS0891434.1 aspartate-alanine antiporter [Tatumella sp. JGM94]MBS0894425.1 aspartate-alanine antiporter [Tatumella sp. JGM130]MBS0902412.1 aspartate-alanine antiporter [Tatumella sp. JGM100]
MNWIVGVLRTYPEIAIFLALGIGYWFGGKSYRGFSLGVVTSTLIAALIIGSVGIEISAAVKSIFFLMFLFAVGYGVGPQFVQGIAKDGLPQALFAVVVCVICLLCAAIAAWAAHFNLGSAAGLFAGSQTISSSMGLATDAINRLGLPASSTQGALNDMPVAYAVTYIFGTIGSAVFLALIGPKMLGIDLASACKDYEAKLGGGSAGNIDDEGTAWHNYVLRAYKISAKSPVAGKTIKQVEQENNNNRLFIEGLRRNGEVLNITADLRILQDDILAVGGSYQSIISVLKHADEIADPVLLALPEEGIDVLVTNKNYYGKTLQELASRPTAHGVFIRKIKRGLLSHEIPVLPGTALHRGDVLTIHGLTKDIERAARDLGVADKPVNMADVSFIGLVIFIGAVIGAIVINIGGIPVTLSTAGGTLIAGLVAGWLRSVRPSFGHIPQPTVWFMNSAGLNVFIAVVGLNAAGGFIHGLQTLGLSLFLWGIFSTLVPLIISMYIGRWIFRFHPALLFGCLAGARTTTAALGMICDAAKSNIPALGYTVTYAVGNTLLTIWGMVMIMILS